MHIWHAISIMYTVKPSVYRPRCDRMLLAVAAASRKSIIRSLTKPCANIPVTMVSRKNKPTILARRLGDAVAIGSVMSCLPERAVAKGERCEQYNERRLRRFCASCHAFRDPSNHDR